jgi:hypothetical protein
MFDSKLFPHRTRRFLDPALHPTAQSNLDTPRQNHSPELLDLEPRDLRPNHAARSRNQGWPQATQRLGLDAGEDDATLSEIGSR